MTNISGKTIFSGLQPSGAMHLGNYLGAIKQWIDLQEDNDPFYCVVDEHAITVPYDAKKMHQRIMDTVALYLAAGLDPEKSTLFVQSHVSAHTELAWLLSSVTPFGELSRMTQFKDKSGKHKDGTSVGLFSYPVLMAADILLYQTEVVPVGEDQVQHIELTRTIAKRFNKQFGKVFTLPKAQINKQTARIMSLNDPTKKMSKSDENPKSYIALTDDADTIRKKIKSAVTETEPVFSFKKSGPAVKNLLNIYQSLSEEDAKIIEDRFKDKGYKEFKEDLAELVVSKLQPIQTKFEELKEDDTEIRLILGKGQTIAQQTATRTLHGVKEKMGLI